MNMNLLNEVTQSQLRSDLPNFSSGDTILVHFKIPQDDNKAKKNAKSKPNSETTSFRIQTFEGVVIKRQGSKISETVTVRKVTKGIGVEKCFAIHSPLVEKIEVLKKGIVRRAKLYYLRNLSGKKARIKEDKSAFLKDKKTSDVVKTEKPVIKAQVVKTNEPQA